MSIDLNADLGEGDACDEALLEIVSSCNVACGGHTGDADSMAVTIRLASRRGVAVGAHPSYPDREGFGRTSGFMSGNTLYASLSAQVAALADVAVTLGARLTHLKPHGALYNDAALESELADIVARVAAEAHGHCRLLGPAASALQRAAEQQGLQFVAEGFVDRSYAPDGRLLARSESGAVHRDIDRIAEQATSLAIDQSVRASDGSTIHVACDTLCIHGDTPAADIAARAVRTALEKRGVEIRGFSE